MAKRTPRTEETAAATAAPDVTASVTATAEAPPAMPAPPESPPAPPPVALAKPAHQAPSLGRVVLFTDDDLRVVPALVTNVNEDATIGLHVFYPDGVAGKDKHSGIGHGERGSARSWHWPPRV